MKGMIGSYLCDSCKKSNIKFDYYNTVSKKLGAKLFGKPEAPIEMPKLDPKHPLNKIAIYSDDGRTRVTIKKALENPEKYKDYSITLLGNEIWMDLSKKLDADDSLSDPTISKRVVKPSNKKLDGEKFLSGKKAKKVNENTELEINFDIQLGESYNGLGDLKKKEFYFNKAENALKQKK